VLDHAFYDDKTLSLLLLETDGDSGRPALILLPTASFTEADSLLMCCKVSINSPRETVSIDTVW